MKKVKVKSLSCVWLFATLWTVAYQALLSMGFSRQEYWSALPFPSPGDFPDPGIKPGSPTLQADALTSEPPGKPMTNIDSFVNKRPSSQGYGFSSSHLWMWELTIKKAEHWRTDAFELWFGEDSWESLGLQGYPTSPSKRRSVMGIHW